MANNKITWNDKVSLVTDPTIAEINKVTDSNMNEIKDVVNENADQVMLSDTEPTANDNEIWIDTSENATYINSEVNIGATNVSNTPVWFKQSKNLLSPSNIRYGLYTIGDGTYSSTNNELCTKNKIEIDNTKNYVLSVNSSSSNLSFYVMYYDENNNYLGKENRTFSVGYIVLNTYANYSNAKYVNFRFGTTNISDIMLEEGSTKTTYEPFDNSIIIYKNEIYNTNNLEQYSPIETKIGTWIDGKPVYRKVIESTIFSTDFYYIGTDIESFVNQYGWVQRKDYPKLWQYIPSRVGDPMSISFLATDTSQGVKVEWGSNWQSNYATLFNKIVIVVEYTKTTD